MRYQLPTGHEIVLRDALTHAQARPIRAARDEWQMWEAEFNVTLEAAYLPDGSPVPDDLLHALWVTLPLETLELWHDLILTQIPDLRVFHLKRALK